MRKKFNQIFTYYSHPKLYCIILLECTVEIFVEYSNCIYLKYSYDFETIEFTMQVFNT